MDLLLAAVLIHDPASPHHGQRRHIGITDGRIVHISAGDEPAARRVIRADDAHVSVGWLDLSCVVGDPGYEHREDLTSAAQAAARGGFTEVLLMPDAQPLRQTRAAIAYVRQTAEQLPVRLHPVAAATVDGAGVDLTEMQDLRAAGAVAFSDGPHHPLQRAEVLVRALQYAAPLRAVVMNRSEHRGLSEGGQMHEGEASTRLGLRGLPALAEDVQLGRDLQLLAYASGRLHVSQVSTAAGVRMIRDAKTAGLPVTADVAAHQLTFTDETMPPFETSYKVRPPFRSEADRLALLEGLRDGTLDAVVSAHQPLDVEVKELEFDLADFGATGLETAFSAAWTAASSTLDLDTLLARLTSGPRAVLGWPTPRIMEGAEANLTVFAPTAEWTPTPDATVSKSRNNPFYGHSLRGYVLATVLGPRVTTTPRVAVAL